MFKFKLSFVFLVALLLMGVGCDDLGLNNGDVGDVSGNPEGMFIGVIGEIPTEATVGELYSVFLEINTNDKIDRAEIFLLNQTNARQNFLDAGAGNTSISVGGTPTKPGTYEYRLGVYGESGRGTVRNFTLTVTE